MSVRVSNKRKCCTLRTTWWAWSWSLWSTRGRAGSCSLKPARTSWTSSSTSCLYHSARWQEYSVRVATVEWPFQVAWGASSRASRSWMTTAAIQLSKNVSWCRSPLPFATQLSSCCRRLLSLVPGFLGNVPGTRFQSARWIIMRDKTIIAGPAVKFFLDVVRYTSMGNHPMWKQ